MMPRLTILATLLPQIRTTGRALFTRLVRNFVGFSTTATLLANRSRTIHSRVGLMERESFAQTMAMPQIEAMDIE